MTEIKSKIPLKKQIIKKLAIKLRISEDVVETVVNDQFKGIVQAMKVCDSVEISGFGKFNFLPVKANRFRNKVKDDIAKKEKGEEVKGPNKDLPTLYDDLAYLNQRLLKYDREGKTDSRRLEECDN